MVLVSSCFLSCPLSLLVQSPHPLPGSRGEAGDALPVALMVVQATASSPVVLIHSHPAFPLPNLGKWIAVSCFLLLAPSRSLLWVCSYLCFITALQWVFEMFRESLLNRKWGPSSHVFVCRAGLRPQRRYSVGATASGAGVGELRQAPCFSRTLSHAECPQRSCTGGGVLARHGQIRKIVKPGSLSASRGLT